MNKHHVARLAPKFGIAGGTLRPRPENDGIPLDDVSTWIQANMD